MLQKDLDFFFLNWGISIHIDITGIHNLLKAFNFSKISKLGKQKLPPIQGFYIPFPFNRLKQKSTPFYHIFTESFLEVFMQISCFSSLKSKDKTI